MPPKCTLPDGMIIKPNGVNELDPCDYEEVEKHINVVVTVLRCKRCGHIELLWEETEDSEHIYYKEI